MNYKSILLSICKNKRIDNSINNIKVRCAGSIHQHDKFHGGIGIGLREGRADKCARGHWDDFITISS